MITRNYLAYIAAFTSADLSSFSFGHSVEKKRLRGGRGLHEELGHNGRIRTLSGLFQMTKKLKYFYTFKTLMLGLGKQFGLGVEFLICA